MAFLQVCSYLFWLTISAFFLIKKLYNLKILSQLILELERSDFFQIKALGLKNANILEQRGAAAPLAPLWTRHCTVCKMHFIQSQNAILVLHWGRALQNKHFKPSYAKFHPKIKITYKMSLFEYNSFLWNMVSVLSPVIYFYFWMKFNIC